MPVEKLIVIKKASSHEHRQSMVWVCQLTVAGKSPRSSHPSRVTSHNPSPTAMERAFTHPPTRYKSFMLKNSTPSRHILPPSLVDSFADFSTSPTVFALLYLRFFPPRHHPLPVTFTALRRVSGWSPPTEHHRPFPPSHQSPSANDHTKHKAQSKRICIEVYQGPDKFLVSKKILSKVCRNLTTSVNKMTKGWLIDPMSYCFVTSRSIFNQVRCLLNYQTFNRQI